MSTTVTAFRAGNAVGLRVNAAVSRGRYIFDPALTPADWLALKRAAKRGRNHKVTRSNGAIKVSGGRVIVGTKTDRHKVAATAARAALKSAHMISISQESAGLSALATWMRDNPPPPAVNDTDDYLTWVNVLWGEFMRRETMRNIIRGWRRTRAPSVAGILDTFAAHGPANNAMFKSLIAEYRAHAASIALKRR